jgi:hypothetical protein
MFLIFAFFRETWPGEEISLGIWKPAYIAALETLGHIPVTKVLLSCGQKSWKIVRKFCGNFSFHFSSDRSINAKHQIHHSIELFELYTMISDRAVLLQLLQTLSRPNWPSHFGLLLKFSYNFAIVFSKTKYSPELKVSQALKYPTPCLEALLMTASLTVVAAVQQRGFSYK